MTPEFDTHTHPPPWCISMTTATSTTCIRPQTPFCCCRFTLFSLSSSLRHFPFIQWYSLLMPISFSRRFACDGCELPMGAERSARHSIYIPYIAECSFTFSIVELKVLYVHVARECFTQTKPKIKLKKERVSTSFFKWCFFASSSLHSFHSYCCC